MVLGTYAKRPGQDEKQGNCYLFNQNGGLLGPPLTKEAMKGKMRELCPSLRRLWAAFIG